MTSELSCSLWRSSRSAVLLVLWSVLLSPHCHIPDCQQLGRHVLSRPRFMEVNNKVKSRTTVLMAQISRHVGNVPKKFVHCTDFLGTSHLRAVDQQFWRWSPDLIQWSCCYYTPSSISLGPMTSEKVFLPGENMSGCGGTETTETRNMYIHTSLIP